MFIIQDDFNRTYVDKDSVLMNLIWTVDIKKAKEFYLRDDAAFWFKYSNGYVPSVVVFPQV